jgi:hypothetical protein
MMNLTSRTSFLVLMAHLKPEMNDAIIPYGPKISEGSRHVMASMVIKSITRQIKDPNIAKELQWVGSNLFEAGAKSMNYDDDDWCPTIPRHHFETPDPVPWLWKIRASFEPQPEPWRSILGEAEVMLNPQPLPPHELSYFGALLTLLADAVSLEKIPDVLRNIGASLMKQSSEKTNENDYSNASSFSSIENGK